jgi:hypothetical protein
MDVIHPRCAGLDVHKETVFAYVRLAAGSKVTREVPTFKTTTSDLLELLAWLTGRGCTRVSRWKRPGLLEASLAHPQRWCVRADAGECRASQECSGRKTDVNDATWIADLLRHRLIQASFVPPREIQELRAVADPRAAGARTAARSRQELAASSASSRGSHMMLDIVFNPAGDRRR